MQKSSEIKLWVTGKVESSEVKTNNLTKRTDLILRVVPLKMRVVRSGADDRRAPRLSIEPMRAFFAVPEVYENYYSY